MIHSVWHPLSALLLVDPPCLATVAVLRMMLATGRQPVRYAGDAMWPTIAHGDRVEVEPLGERPPEVGEVVVASPDGFPDLFRVAGIDGGRVLLAADAVPGPPVASDAQAVLARCTAKLPWRRGLGRTGRRLLLDLREAWREGPDPAEDPARTVLDKYETQAPFYAESGGPGIEAGLLDRMRREVKPAGRVLVIGSGAGGESLALADAGWQVTGVDFSPAMVRLAAEAAAHRRLEVEFIAADIRTLPLQAASLAAVLFTYDVYSFLPAARDRIDLLRRAREALVPGGAVFLSARRLRSAYQRALLTWQWLGRSGGRRAAWGDSHTRWIAGDGSLKRSYVRVFTERVLGEETAAAGFEAGPWFGGHCVLRPAMIDDPSEP